MKILGLGIELPGRAVSTQELANIHGHDGEALMCRPGVVSRHYCEDDQVSMGD